MSQACRKHVAYDKVISSKSALTRRFTRCDFDACDKLLKGLRHDLGPFTRHGFFQLKIKYVKVCARIYGAKVLTNGKQIFQLFCALEKLSNEMFFALIRSVIFEKRLYMNQSTTRKKLLFFTQQKFVTKYVISINFGYDSQRSVLKHVLKSYDNIFDVHNSCKRVVGLILIHEATNVVGLS